MGTLASPVVRRSASPSAQPSTPPRVLSNEVGHAENLVLQPENPVEDLGDLGGPDIFPRPLLPPGVVAGNVLEQVGALLGQLRVKGSAIPLGRSSVTMPP